MYSNCELSCAIIHDILMETPLFRFTFRLHDFN